MRRPALALYLTIWLLSLAGSASAAEILVISKDVPPGQITISQLRNALLGRISLWSDGRPIVIVLSRAPASQERLEALLGRDLDHLLRGWKRLVFTGGGSLPEVTADDALAIRQVANTPGAMAIITGPAANALPTGVLGTRLDLQPAPTRVEHAPSKP